MKNRRWIAFLLAAVMLLCCLSGCGNAQKTTEFDKLYNAYGADEVMATVDGVDITWGIYIYALYTAFETLEGQYGEIPEWSREIYEGTTYSDFVKDYAMYDCKYYAVVEAKARELGITVDEDGEAEIQGMWENAASQYDSEDAFMDSLAAKYCSRESYMYMLRIQYLYHLIQAEIYGEDGELISEKDLLQYVEDQGYMMAKIIVFLSYDPDTGEAYDDVERTQRLASAKKIVKELDAYTGDDIAGYFTELMDEYNQDTGAQYFPDGYLFTESDLGSVVYEACGKLSEYEYSSVVSSDYGYYIILRLPINTDVTPVAYSTYAYYGYDYPLRAAAADDLLSQQAATWESEVEMETAASYDNLFLGDYLTMPVTFVATTEDGTE